MLLNLSTFSIISLLLSAAGYLLYRFIRPKPIPGIPYHKPSAQRLFGDVPDCLKYISEHGDMAGFLTQRCLDLDSPIFQIFVRPFQKPWVVVADAQESSDIMIRRAHQFDRSNFFGDLFIEWMPGFQASMKTGEKWRAHRRLVGDAMSPSFLNNIASPLVYKGALDLIALWHEKMRLANGHPFEAAEDLHNGIMDAVWGATFGSMCGVNQSQVDLLSRLKQRPEDFGKGKSVSFPRAPNPEEFEAVITITHSCDIPIRSPIPRLHHRLALRFSPKLSAAVARKNKMFSDKLDAAWSKFSQYVSSDKLVSCVMDLVLQKEVLAAQKESRAPDHKSNVIRDELLGFLVAGHETTATTLAWGLKLLTDHPSIQSELRGALRANFARAKEASDMPTADEITKSHIPLLEAVMQEFLRVGATAAINIRTVTEDTEVLGHTVPKGTDVFMLVTGPSYRSPAFPIDDSKRSATSVQSESKVGTWTGDDIGAFKPTRWLVKNEAGDVEYDPKAGPQNTFGAGPRSCFGQRLAYIEMRIFLVMIIWNLELLPVAPELSTYAATDVLVHKPQQCYVRLAAAK